MAKGVILAPTAYEGDQIQKQLGLTDWIVLTPRSIKNGAGRGIIPEPDGLWKGKILLVDDVDLLDVWREIAPMFGPYVHWDECHVHRLLRYRPCIEQRTTVEYTRDDE